MVHNKYGLEYYHIYSSPYCHIYGEEYAPIKSEIEQLRAFTPIKSKSFIHDIFRFRPKKAILEIV